MSHDDDQQRYDEILNRIANRKPFGRQVEKQLKSAYDLILDHLNAYDTLAPISTRKYQTILCYGPQVIRKSTWSGVVAWYFNKGYYGYRNLNLFGVWVYQQDSNIHLSIGIRALPYCAAVYNPEGFHVSIRKDFKLFYEDNGHPPSETDTPLFTTIYQQKERLTLRQTLQSYINQWHLDIESD